MTATVMILGGMLMILSPLLSRGDDESAFVGTARALRRVLAPTPAVPADMANQLDEIERADS